MSPDNNQLTCISDKQVEAYFERGYFGLESCKDGDIKRKFRNDRFNGAYEWKLIKDCTEEQICANAKCIDKEVPKIEEPTEDVTDASKDEKETLFDCTQDELCPDGTVFAKCVDGYYTDILDECPSGGKPKREVKTGGDAKTDEVLECSDKEIELYRKEDNSPQCFKKSYLWGIVVGIIVVLVAVIIVAVSMKKGKKRKR